MTVTWKGHMKEWSHLFGMILFVLAMSHDKQLKIIFTDLKKEIQSSSYDFKQHNNLIWKLLSNDSDMEGSYKLNGDILFTQLFFYQLYNMNNNSKYFLQTQKSQYSHQVMTLSSCKKFILEIILSNDCDIESSHERKGDSLFA